MENILQKNEEISLCYKGICLHAEGQNAILLGFVFFAMFLLGIVYLSKAN